jgi:hypothetical protein
MRKTSDQLLDGTTPKYGIAIQNAYIAYPAKSIRSARYYGKP